MNLDLFIAVFIRVMKFMFFSEKIYRSQQLCLWFHSVTFKAVLDYSKEIGPIKLHKVEHTKHRIFSNKRPLSFKRPV